MDERRRQDAEQFVETLLASRREPDEYAWQGGYSRYAREYPHHLYGLYRADIELNTDRFLHQIRLAERQDIPFPCLSVRHLGSVIPIDLFSVLEFSDLLDRPSIQENAF